MPVEVVQQVEELAKNGAGLPILAYNDEEPTEISVQIEGVIHDEVPDTPVLYDGVINMKMLNKSRKTMSRPQLKLKK